MPRPAVRTGSVRRTSFVPRLREHIIGDPAGSGQIAEDVNARRSDRVRPGHSTMVIVSLAGSRGVCGVAS